MSNSYSLADIKSELDNEYKPLELTIEGEKVVLVNPMRLDAKVRSQLATDYKALDTLFKSDDADPLALDAPLDTVLSTVVADGKGPFLVDVIAGDTGLAMKLLNMWAQVTQAPEASPSPS